MKQGVRDKFGGARTEIKGNIKIIEPVVIFIVSYIAVQSREIA